MTEATAQEAADEVRREHLAETGGQGWTSEPPLRERLQAAYPKDDPTPMWMRLAVIKDTLETADTNMLGYDELHELAERLFEMATSRT